MKCSIYYFHDKTISYKSLYLANDIVVLMCLNLVPDK